jgi:hypothetical protein
MTAFNTSQMKRTVPSLQSFGVLALLSALIAGPASLTIRLVEPGLVLHALSILFFSYATIAAIVARSTHAHRNSENITLWDIAGALTLMGCAATIFSEPDQVALLFEQLFERPFGYATLGDGH